MASATDAATRIGSYEVVETVYTGDLSVVYRCRDDTVPRDVAVKAVRAENPQADRVRLYALREARLRALVEHPGLLPLHRVEDGDTGPLLVAPWLAGGALRDLPPGMLEAAELVDLAAGLARGLGALHRAGWRHGDVSPGNILFHEAPGPGVPVEPVLCDLGSAARIGTRPRGASLVVTPNVTAPEVWTARPADGRADVYSLGVVLYQLLTRSWPYEARDAAEFAELHCRAPVPSAARRSPAVGPAVDEVLRQALAKDPEGRHATCAELAEAFRDAARADGLTGMAGPSRTFERDRRAVALAAAGERLEDFAATLDDRDRAALEVVLRRSAAVGARAAHDTEQMATQTFAPAAALLALEDCGAAAALAGGGATPHGVAAACGAPERAIARLLELLAATGFLARDGDRYRLPPGPAALYERDASAHPLRDSAIFWGRLSQWAATGIPFMEMDRPDGAIYAGIVGEVTLLEAPAADELAEALVERGLVPDGAEILDVGAGSGVWSVAVASARPGARVTALDRAPVLEQARKHAEAAGLGDRFSPLAGDWRAASLPSSAYDVVVVANLCHLEAPEDVERLFARVRPALRGDGIAVVVDTIPDPGEPDAQMLLHDLHLALRTPGGGIHGRAGYERWLDQVGFDVPDSIVLTRSGGGLTALVARPSRGRWPS